VTQLSLQFVESITEISPATWNGLAGTDNPFMRHEFLVALEETHCTTRATGWQPHHIIVRSDDDGLAAAVMPLYLKTNSYGEYVFDWSWAHAYQQHGMAYYPKFVTSAPFTPSTGRRCFIRPDIDESEVLQLITEKVQESAEFIQASSWHILFPTETEHEQLNALGLMPRTACQFHWANRGYSSFDDFLATMSSRKRKNIRKERRKVAEEGIHFRRMEGEEISETIWQEFYTFYQSTYLMRGMQGYLTQDFFLQLSRTMPKQLFMICAEQGGKLIAAALFFKSSDTLFGRYWGSAQDYQFLHFETCYYQGQDYAIEHGFKYFDSGAQGEHKIQRGFEPIFTFSNHWIAHPGFRAAVQHFLDEEASHIKNYKTEAASLLPFKTS